MMKKNQRQIKNVLKAQNRPDLMKNKRDCLKRINDNWSIILFSREIGTIIRSLGCCPTEGELHDMLAEVRYLLFQGFIHTAVYLIMKLS